MSSFISETTYFDVSKIEFEEPVFIDGKGKCTDFYSRRIHLTMENGSRAVIKMFSENEDTLRIHLQ